MSGTVQHEFERKYDVADGVAVPPLADESGSAVTTTLVAEYFDTADLVLARSRVVVRRRRGGEDEGWHIKTPDSSGGRLERHWPLGGESPPDELLDRVRVLLRGEAIVPVARIVTSRTTCLLEGDRGRVVAELSDDRVEATDLRDGVHRSWREWEVEIVDPGRMSAERREATLDAVQAHLEDAGARASTSPSKLSRALGLDADAARPASRAPSLTGSSSAGEVLCAVVGRLTGDVQRFDPDARSGDAEAIHEMRSSVHRLRSVLGTFDRVWDGAVVGALRGELRALGLALGAVRDPLVTYERARKLVRSQPDKRMHEPVMARLVREKEAQSRSALVQLRGWLDSPRYFAMLDGLGALADADGFAGFASRPAESELLRGLKHAYKRTRRTMRRSEGTAPAKDRETRLHAVRKAARRLRFAAEAVCTPPGDVFGDRIARLARAAERVQDALGDHRDSVVLQAALVESAALAHASGDDTFGHGRLHALEQLRADTRLAEYSRAAERLVRARRLLR